ncbi:MAG: beta strand repeat-containing protein, partial [Saprospiraceae bacterium]
MSKHLQIFFTLLWIAITTVTYGQTTTWNGNVNTDWNNAGNWSNGVPTATTTNAIIEAVTNHPNITSGTMTVSRKVKINPNATLTINAGATLTLEGSNDDGLRNQGTVVNNGTIRTDNSGSHGIANETATATFTNNGIIQIERAGAAALNNAGTGRFINQGTIKIGKTHPLAAGGIANINGSTFTNASGMITIDNTTNNAIYQQSELTQFNNQATLTIGANAKIGKNGIFNAFEAGFTNQNGGIINVDNTNENGILNQNRLTTFSNMGTITIGSNTRVGVDGILNKSGATFTNETNSRLTIDNTVTASIDLESANTLFTNKGIIEIRKNGSSNRDGIEMSLAATFNNLSSGVINIFAAGDDGILVAGAMTTFTNEGTIVIGDNATIKDGIEVQFGGLFRNEAGTITINNTINHGIYVHDNNAQFINKASIIIGINTPAGKHGILNSSTTIFTNETGGNIQINKVNELGIWNQENAVFTNKATIQIGDQNKAIAGGINNLSGSTFTNEAGSITVDNTTLNGIFQNNNAQFINQATLLVGTNSIIGTNFLRSDSGAQFSNSSCAVVKAFAPLNNRSVFTNAGFVMIETTRNSRVGNFTNNGLVNAVGFVFNTNNNNDAIIDETIACINPFTDVIKIGSMNNFVADENWYTDAALTNLAGQYDADKDEFVAASNLARGTQTLYFKVTDNQTHCEELVSIQLNYPADNEKPAFSNCADASFNTDNNSCVYVVTNNDLNVTATDNCAVQSLTYSANNNATIPTNTTLNGATFQIGETTVTATATDVNGNVSTCTFKVTVSDNERPSILGFVKSSFNTNTNSCSYTLTNDDFSTRATDNCAVASEVYNADPDVTISNPSTLNGAILPIGSSIILYTVTDVSGNRSQQSFNVEVVDNVKPTFSDCSDEMVNTDTGECDYTITDNRLDRRVMDNCQISSVRYSTESELVIPDPTTLKGVVLPVGETTFTLKVADNSHNETDCTFKIIVSDNEKPVPAVSNLSDVTEQCSATITAPKATDNCASG